MTIDQILKRLELGNRVQRAEVHRLERRRLKLQDELERIEQLLPGCYVQDQRWGKRLNPDVVDA